MLTHRDSGCERELRADGLDFSAWPGLRLSQPNLTGKTFILLILCDHYSYAGITVFSFALLNEQKKVK